MSNYQARCPCGDFCGVDSENAVRDWATRHKSMCEVLSERKRNIRIWKVVDTL